MGSQESVFLTRVIASCEVMARVVQGIIVQSEGGDSWVASHLRPQSGTNIGNISLDFHHSCAHRPRKCEIQPRKTGLSVSIANNCLQNISYASLAPIFLFFQTLSFFPHSHLHVLLTSSFLFYSHYCHLPSKFSFFIFIPMSPILTSFLPLSPFLYFHYYYFLLYIPPSIHHSCLSSISCFFIKLLIYSSHTFICTSHPFPHILYFFLQQSFSILLQSLLSLFQYLISSHPSSFSPFIPAIILFFQSSIQPFSVTICQVPDKRHDIGKHRLTGDTPLASWFQ